MKVKTNYTECEYITPGKEYRVYRGPYNHGQKIICDAGGLIEIVAPPWELACPHLNGEGFWEIVEEEDVQ